MLFSTNTGSVGRRLGIPATVELIASAGFPCADISLFYSNPAVDKWDRSALARELNAISASTGIRYNQAHAPFSSDLDTHLREIVPQLPYAFEMCALIGVPTMVIHPVKDYNKLYYENREEMLDVNVSFYNSLAPLAREYGVKIAIENMFHRHPVSRAIGMGICGTAEEHIALYERLDCKELYTLCLDVGHSCLTMQRPDEVIRALGGNRLTALHIQDLDMKDDVHTLPGLSRIDYEPILKALGEIDYKGEFTLECDNFFANIPTDFLPYAYSFASKIAGGMADKIDYYRR